MILSQFIQIDEYALKQLSIQKVNDSYQLQLPSSFLPYCQNILKYVKSQRALDENYDLVLNVYFAQKTKDKRDYKNYTVLHKTRFP